MEGGTKAGGGGGGSTWVECLVLNTPPALYALFPSYAPPSHISNAFPPAIPARDPSVATPPRAPSGLSGL
jgi:hypothetical protein